MNQNFSHKHGDPPLRGHLSCRDTFGFPWGCPLVRGTTAASKGRCKRKGETVTFFPACFLILRESVKTEFDLCLAIWFEAIAEKTCKAWSGKLFVQWDNMSFGKRGSVWKCTYSYSKKLYSKIEIYLDFEYFYRLPNLYLSNLTDKQLRNISIHILQWRNIQRCQKYDIWNVSNFCIVGTVPGNGTQNDRQTSRQPHREPLTRLTIWANAGHIMSRFVEVMRSMTGFSAFSQSDCRYWFRATSTAIQSKWKEEIWKDICNK